MSAEAIIRLNSEPAVRLAGIELRDCLAKATGRTLSVLDRKRYAPDRPAVWLGLFSDFPEVEADGDGADADAYLVRVGADGGIVAGTNARSVLLGVYRYLTELGFRWVRPGADGEFVPAQAQVDVGAIAVTLRRPR